MGIDVIVMQNPQQSEIQINELLGLQLQTRPLSSLTFDPPKVKVVVFTRSWSCQNRGTKATAFECLVALRYQEVGDMSGITKVGVNCAGERNTSILFK